MSTSTWEQFPSFLLTQGIITNVSVLVFTESLNILMSILVESQFAQSVELHVYVVITILMVS